VQDGLTPIQPACITWTVLRHRDDSGANLASDRPIGNEEGTQPPFRLVTDSPISDSPIEESCLFLVTYESLVPEACSEQGNVPES